MTRSLYWVRHAATNARGLYGWTDVGVDLSDRQNLSWLNETLPDRALIIASDLKRASLTADAIQGNRTRLPNEKNLRELHFGRWEGKTHQEVSEIDKVLAIDFWEKPGGIKAPEGESWNDLSHRVNEVVDRITRLYPKNDLVFVAHYAVILTQIQRVLGVSTLQVLHRRIHNLSLTKVTERNSKLELDFSNKLSE
ncbi:MAG: histidine phosphatase family protein [Rhodobacteraceae bacterium]|nr:histidine phosphatase family protein [Paracoccaceae bacterium]MCY4250969.1 histidine phosphatase family protein [Paracoccaceae bacterium]MCY4309159.1 histidine phosphatase family protein [Paracoccaceae bacterium]